MARLEPVMSWIVRLVHVPPLSAVQVVVMLEPARTTVDPSGSEGMTWALLVPTSARAERRSVRRSIMREGELGAR